MRILFSFRLVLMLVIVLLIDSSASGQKLPDTTRLLRFPATNGRQIVFCYAGELYTVGKEGGIARRLTSGPGYSSFPRFSADGTQLAFTSQYDGNTEGLSTIRPGWRKISITSARKPAAKSVTFTFQTWDSRA